MYQFLTLLLRFVVPLLTAALVMLAFNVLSLVLLLKLSITSGALSTALLARFFVRFFAALLVMIFCYFFFQIVKQSFYGRHYSSTSLPCIAPLYLLFIFIGGGNLDLGAIVHPLQTKVTNCVYS